MVIYVKRREEFEVKRYTPNEAGFDVQNYIDWIMSFEGKGGTWPSNAVQNPNGNITITWYDPAGGEWETTVSDGMYGYVRVVPVSNYEMIDFLTETEFNAKYQAKV